MDIPNSGSSALVLGSGVAIASPATGEVLTYSSSDSKWTMSLSLLRPPAPETWNRRVAGAYVPV